MTVAGAKRRGARAIVRAGIRTGVCLAATVLLAAGLLAHPAAARTYQRGTAAAPVSGALPGVPADAQALGGYDILIADRGNNRALIVTPDKRIIWDRPFVGIPPGHGADDSFFVDGGKRIIASFEHEQLIEIIDVATKKAVWRYGHIGHRGHLPGYLNFPDDAYVLPNGDVSVADIRNCRILEIAPDKHIVRQAGITDRCDRRASPFLASPNGDTPLPNGHMLISTIRDHSLVELNRNWKPILRMRLPILYPSDPQLTKAGNIVVASYTHPGKIIVIKWDGTVIWSFEAKGQGGLNKPSLAMELPNGNIMATDDLNHRVIVIDRATKRIVWQYGVTGRRGRAPGYLHIPDGLDIMRGETKWISDSNVRSRLQARR